ncbi:MAG: menaquinone biosynthesis protein [Planctomycetaceae bacterium]
MNTSQPRPLRIGAVSYLNSKPLVEGLSDLAPTAELMLDYPSRLADDLAAGLLDVALIPSVECLMDPSYEIISDACVATRGPVLSVKMYSRVHPRDIRSLALDEGSRTSAALSRILLAERYGVEPTLESLPMGQNPEDSSTDAVLVIGDRAMHPPAESFVETWDLGEEWTRSTDLPFVFAMWAARQGTDLGDLEQALEAARDLGVSTLENIAERESAALGISAELAVDYLKNNLHFRLGDAEHEGLERFRATAARWGVVPEQAGPPTR